MLGINLPLITSEESLTTKDKLGKSVTITSEDLKTPGRINEVLYGKEGLHARDDMLGSGGAFNIMESRLAKRSVEPVKPYDQFIKALTGMDREELFTPIVDTIESSNNIDRIKPLPSFNEFMQISPIEKGGETLFTPRGVVQPELIKSISEPVLSDVKNRGNLELLKPMQPLKLLEEKNDDLLQSFGIIPRKIFPREEELLSGSLFEAPKILKNIFPQDMSTLVNDVNSGDIRKEDPNSEIKLDDSGYSKATEAFNSSVSKFDSAIEKLFNILGNVSNKREPTTVGGKELSLEDAIKSVTIQQSKDKNELNDIITVTEERLNKLEDLINKVPDSGLSETEKNSINEAIREARQAKLQTDNLQAQLQLVRDTANDAILKANVNSRSLG